MPTSDVRLKVDIDDLDIEEALAWVDLSRPVSFRRKATLEQAEDDATIEAGFIAQEQMAAGFERYVVLTASPGMPEQTDGGITSPADFELELPLQYQIAYLTVALKNALSRIEMLESLVIP